LIFISTGGHSRQTAWSTCRQFYEVGLLCAELSGGLAEDAQLSKLKSMKHLLQFQIHNYFPPPKSPFVFNLASLNQGISNQSYQHVLKAMHWAIELDRPCYSFHAGFLLDPHVDELGRCIRNRDLVNRNQALARFITQVNKLAEYARKVGVSLLIENNVLSAKTCREFASDPFLMTTAEECVFVMRNTPSNVNLLVDVAHLKVSSRSLQFDPVGFLTDCDPWIHAYHLSDNDGKIDSNEPVGGDSWFWPYLKRGLDYYSLECYNNPLLRIVEQYQLIQRKLDE